MKLRDEVSNVYQKTRGKRVSQRFYSPTLKREVILERETLGTVTKLVAAGEIALSEKKKSSD